MAVAPFPTGFTRRRPSDVFDELEVSKKLANMEALIAFKFVSEIYLKDVPAVM